MTEETQALMSMDDIESLESAVTNALEDSPEVTGDGDAFFRLHQDESPTPGRLTIGLDEERVTPEQFWMMNTQSLQHGFVLQDMGEVEDQEMVPINERLPEGYEDDRGGFVPFDKKDGWELAYSAEFGCVLGNLKGKVAVYSHYSMGVQRMFKETILRGLRVQIERRTGKYFPVLKFSVGQYQRGKKTIYFPKVDIVEWLGQGDEYQESPAKAEPRRSQPVREDDTDQGAVVDGHSEEVSPDEEGDRPRARRGSRRSTRENVEDSPRSTRRTRRTRRA